jgi:hypothetical protein
MKHALLAVATAALATTGSAAVAKAQTQRAVVVGIAAGASLPTGDLSDQVKTGYNALATIGIGAPSINVGMRVDGMLNQFGQKSSGTGDLRVLGLSANLVLTLPGVLVKPYMIGGVGYYNAKFTGGDRSATTETGYNVGLGTTFSLASFSSFAELRFHHVPKTVVDAAGNSQSADFFPLTFGVIF